MNIKLDSGHSSYKGGIDVIFALPAAQEARLLPWGHRNKE